MQPKKIGRVQMEWVYWQEQQSRDFHASIATWFLIQMAPTLQWRCPPLRGGNIQNLKKIPLAIPKIWAIKLLKNFFCFFLFVCTLCINCYNYACFNLVEIWYTYWGCKSKYQYQNWDNSQAYRINCFEEQAENQYVARLNIRGVLLGG